MVQLRRRSYPLNHKTGSETRSTLLARARKGDSNAQVNLMELDDGRMHAQTERKQTTVMDFLTQSARTTKYRR
jgi:hypothetical protein